MKYKGCRRFWNRVQLPPYQSIKYLQIVMALILLGLAFFGGPVPLAYAGTIYTVTNTSDSGAGSLRQAILDANATPGNVLIKFNIPHPGPHTIQPLSQLPIITDSVIIDGYSQPGSSPNTNPLSSGSNAMLMIELDGSNAGTSGVNGLLINSENCQIKGLTINRFSGSGIYLIWGGGNVIEGNFIGTNVTGTADLGNQSNGVRVYRSVGNTIGGTTSGARNIVSGNNSFGVNIGVVTPDNVVQGNFIGTDVTGTVDLGNGSVGVGTASSNTAIGGTTVGAGNIISGNGNAGVQLSGVGLGVSGNLVQGNLIGTDVTGTVDLGNSGYGISIFGNTNTLIGGTTLGAGNVISGNNYSGIYFGGARETVVQGNFIGTDVTGTINLGNGWDGIRITNYGIYHSSDNMIGGTTVSARNIISANNSNGVYIYGAGNTGNLVQGNFIGTDVTGSLDLGNSTDGVQVWGAANNTIGGSTAASRNVISGNQRFGVNIVTGGPEDNNSVLGNFIGTDVSGILPLGNGRLGVQICGLPCVLNGEPSSGLNATVDGNVISYNAWAGVALYSGTNIVTNNILTDNVLVGVETHGGANVIGDVGAGNTISGSRTGINEAGGSNTLLGNMITGNRDGVVLQVGTNTVGGALSGQGNTITANTRYGIRISALASTNNISGNIINSNGGHGITITSATSTNNIGGVASGAGNIINQNGGNGVFVSTGIENAILSNSIFSNAALGIDLAPSGVTPNDVGDADIGANNLQNFPVLELAVSNSGGTLVDGDLQSTKNTQFRLEFFVNDTCDPSGHGEGETFLDSTMVTTDVNGNASFTLNLTTPVSMGKYITATATDPNNNTSEFSHCIGTHLLVEIDIKPSTNNNSINLSSEGVIPVAILTTNEFDASNVIPSTVIFANASPLRWTLEDVDRDGDTDLLFHFRTQELNLDANSTVAILTGNTHNKMVIGGADSLNIVPEDI